MKIDSMGSCQSVEVGKTGQRPESKTGIGFLFATLLGLKISR